MIVAVFAIVTIFAIINVTIINVTIINVIHTVRELVAMISCQIHRLLTVLVWNYITIVIVICNQIIIIGVIVVIVIIVINGRYYRPGVTHSFVMNLLL